jgi:hypothetical protein
MRAPARHRKKNVEWTRATAEALRQTGAALDAEVADRPPFVGPVVM